MELIRSYFPFNGFEWGAPGYALSDQVWARALAPLYGTSGITVLTVLVGGHRGRPHLSPSKVDAPRGSVGRNRCLRGLVVVAEQPDGGTP